MPKYNNEILIARATITSDVPISLPSEFHRLFQSDHLSIGTTEVRFPIHDHELSADLSSFQEQFPFVKVEIGSNAIEEY